MKILINHRVRGNDAGKTCAVEDCSRLVKAWALCNVHYQRQRKIKNGASSLVMQAPIHTRSKPSTRSPLYDEKCSVENCSYQIKYLKARMCSMHKQRADKGQPLTGPRARRNRRAMTTQVCTVEVCSRVADGLDGLCNPHTQRANRIARAYPVSAKMEDPVRGTPEYREKITAGQCSVRGCSGIVRAKGFCNGHYQQHLDGVEIFLPLRRNNYWHSGEPCRVSVCDEKSHCRGLCRKHYSKYKMYGENGVAALERWLKDGCEVCGDKKDLPHIDHDHKCCANKGGSGRKTCGKCIRGALCYRCNMALGLLNDSASTLNGMISYLTRDAVNERRREA